jgi:VanZ family protein
MSLRLATLVYVVVIAYGTLFSTEGWQVPREWHFLAWEGLRGASRADMIENVLGYIPFGILMAASLALSMSRGAAIASTLLAGALLSLSLETIQAFVPGRDSSATDLLMNTTGTFIGALASVLVDPGQSPSRTLVRIRSAWFSPGLAGNLGIGVAVLWIASQLSPFIPTIDVATVRQGLSSAWRTLQHPESLKLSQAFVYFCYLGALGAAWSMAARKDVAGAGTYSLLVLAVLLAKPLFVARELSLEALVGFCASIPVMVMQGTWPEKVRGILGAILLCAGFLAYEIAPAAGPLHEFNWVPLRGEITNTLNGIMNMVGLLWVFFTLGALVRMASARDPGRAYELLGGGVVVLLVALCEWFQQGIPGRYGDITTVGIALVGWIAAWRVRDERDALVATPEFGTLAARSTQRK